MDFRVFILRHLDFLNALGFWTIRVLFPKSMGHARDAYSDAAHELLATPLTLSQRNELFFREADASDGAKLPEMVGAVIYVRVSMKEQTENLSLPTQLRACEEYCRRHGYEVLERFHEEGESAKTTDRTQLQALLKYCRTRKGKVHFVVVYNLTRFAREKYDHFALRAHLQSLGISLRSATEPIDDTSSWPSQNAFCHARQTCGCRRLWTTSSDCSSCSSRRESRSTEIDSIEPPQRHHFSTTWRRLRVLMKRW
jgi:hypothetical protein